MGVTASYVQIDQAAQLLSRQHAHTIQMGSYLESQCRLTSGDLGLVLQVLHPISEAITDGAALAIRTVGDLSQWASTSATQTLDTYVATDRTVYEAMSRITSQLGASLPPFSDPRGALPALGGASSTAEAGYGSKNSEYHPVADAIADGIGVGQSALDLATGTLNTAADRLSGLGRTGVEERTDPVSYLVSPQSSVNFMEDLRWKAGLILGSIDWVAEQFCGFSILNEYVYKPLGGNWQRIDGASQAWGHEARAFMEMSSNFSGLPKQTGDWTGEAALRFSAAMAALSGGTVGLSYAFDTVSSMVGAVKTASYLASSGIAAALQYISNKLMRLAIEGSIPVAGWIVAGVEAIEAIQKVFFYLRLINTLITAILDAISDLISAREKLVQSAMVLEDLIEAAAARAVR